VGTTRFAVVVAALAVGAAVAWPAVAIAQPANLCDPQSVDSNQMCQFHASGVYDDVDMTFPANYPQQQAVVDYLNHVLTDYQEASGPAESRTSPHALDVTGTRYSSGAPHDGTQSVALKVYQNVGAAHPLTWYKAFNYDTGTRAPLTYDQLFRPDAKPLEVVLPIVQQDLTRQFGQQVTVPPETGLDPANYQNFAVTNDAVIFFFDKDQLLPAIEAAEVSVPRTAIAPLLTAGV
jgi:hypothetical protein